MNFIAYEEEIYSADTPPRPTNLTGITLSVRLHELSCELFPPILWGMARNIRRNVGGELATNRGLFPAKF